MAAIRILVDRCARDYWAGSIQMLMIPPRTWAAVWTQFMTKPVESGFSLMYVKHGPLPPDESISLALCACIVLVSSQTFTSTSHDIYMCSMQRWVWR